MDWKRHYFLEQADHWTPPAELKAYLPRSVRLSASGIAVSILGVFFLLGAAFALVALDSVARSQALDARLLREQGVAADAVVTRLCRAGDKSRSSMVAYQFACPELACGGRAEVSFSRWKQMSPGSPLPVHFVPSRPALNHPDGWERPVMPGWVPWLAGVALALVGTFVLTGVRRQKQLLSEGFPAPGTVTRYSRTQHGQRNVYYEFRLSSGEKVRGKTGPVREVPDLGSTLTVLYLQDSPRRNSAYPMQMVKLR